jgi:hypothetical protein
MNYHYIKKWQLAYMYGVHRNTLMRSLAGIMVELEQTGLKPYSKCFTPKQMQLIIEYLGVPQTKKSPTMQEGLM